MSSKILNDAQLRQLAHEFMRDYGANNAGEITLNEFCSGTIKRLPAEVKHELERNVLTKKNLENEMKIIFYRFDTNKDGKIDLTEVESLLKEIFAKHHEQIIHLSDKEIKQAAQLFLDQYDENKDGKITFDEFHSRTWQTLPEHIKLELEQHADVKEHLNGQIRQVFDAHDTDKNGVIQLIEIENLLRQTFF